MTVEVAYLAKTEFSIRNQYFNKGEVNFIRYSYIALHMGGFEKVSPHILRF